MRLAALVAAGTLAQACSTAQGTTEPADAQANAILARMEITAFRTGENPGAFAVEQPGALQG